MGGVSKHMRFLFALIVLMYARGKMVTGKYIISGKIRCTIRL